jgi:geranylgeranyl diphosphate synthase, type I
VQRNVRAVVDSRDAVIARVEAELASFLDARAADLVELGDDLIPLADYARVFVLDGGKRLRPTFAYWGWRSAGCTDAPDDTALFTAAASLELLHASALVHDDVMDASDTRRGKPATHTAFATLHREAGWTGDPAAFGDAAAIVLGDLLLSWSEAMFASVPMPARARAVFDDTRQLVMGGQYLDILVQARAEFSADQALRVIRFKTSKYTVEGPLHLGASIAGAGEEVFAALSAYGLAVGEAFQLRDDVLGVFGDPSVTGKPAGDDLRAGKQTLLTALAARDPRGAPLRRRLGEPGLDAAEVDELRDIIAGTGALAEVEQRIVEQVRIAHAALHAGAIDPAARQALVALGDAATNRHA